MRGDEATLELSETGGLRKRQVRMADGRYLIFFTFSGEEAPRAEGAGRREPPPQRPEAEEERRV